jgi:hypothetical protein
MWTLVSSRIRTDLHIEGSSHVTLEQGCIVFKPTQIDISPHRLERFADGELLIGAWGPGSIL